MKQGMLFYEKRWSMKPAVIFDFNGTMVFDAIYHEQAWKQFAIKLRGHAFTSEEMKMMHGKPNIKIIEYLKPDCNINEAIELSKAKEALYRDIALQDDAYQLVHGLEAFLKALQKEQIALNIASASIIENIEFFIQQFQLDRWFDPTKIIYDNNTYENKVAMFKDAAKQLQVEIGNCYVFEDSLSGIQCAYEAGVKGIIVIGNHQAANQLGVIKTIDDYSTINELLALLK